MIAQKLKKKLSAAQFTDRRKKEENKKKNGKCNVDIP